MQRSQRSSPHQQLDLLEQIHALEELEIESERHATVRRVARFFDDTFPELGRIRCWWAATQLLEREHIITIKTSYLEALRDVALSALDVQACAGST